MREYRRIQVIVINSKYIVYIEFKFVRFVVGVVVTHSNKMHTIGCHNCAQHSCSLPTKRFKLSLSKETLAIG